MKTFASKEKGYNRQLATAYIAGMMIGSYFYKSTYCSVLEEKHLYLHYAEMPRAKQYDQEEAVLRHMAQLGQDFLKRLQDLKCQIRCWRQGEKYLLEFDTGGFESLHCTVDKQGSCRITGREGSCQLS